MPGESCTPHLTSVKDFPTADALIHALRMDDHGECRGGRERTEPEASELSNAEWTLGNYDPETTEVSSLSEEFHRLQVLKSYFVLDEECEESLDRLTAMAGRMFDVPICVVSLVDLGRLWFISNRGLGDMRTIPRKDAFCSHAVLDKRDLLVIPDASSDPRFRDNPIVTGGPSVRFYAGAPLVTPEGFKIGNFCLIDNRARVEGMTADERETLMDFAKTTVKIMVDRRYRILMKEKREQMIAYTAHDLMTPLSGLQLSLSLLTDDTDLQEKVDIHQKEMLATATSCTEIMARICQSALENLREEVQPDYTIGPTTTSGGSLCQLTDLVGCLYQVRLSEFRQVKQFLKILPTLSISVASPLSLDYGSNPQDCAHVHFYR